MLLRLLQLSIVLTFGVATEVPQLDLSAAASSTDQGFSVTITRSETSGVGITPSRSHGGAALPQALRPTLPAEVVVSSGGYEEFEAVLSSGCFDPADYTYQCVNDGVVDPEIDPADPVRATAPISQAQFQDLVYREFASLPLTGSGLVHQPQGEVGLPANRGHVVELPNG